MTNDPTAGGPTLDEFLREGGGLTWEESPYGRRKLIEATVVLESAVHPDDCDTWDEDRCNCGLEVALKQLWQMVGADSDGRVESGHALQAARAASFEAWKALHGR